MEDGNTIKSWLQTLSDTQLDQLIDDIKTEKLDRVRNVMQYPQPELVGSLGPVFQPLHVYPHTKTNEASEK